MTDSKSVVPAAADRKTLVEEGTEFRGSLSSNCPVVVKGRVEGDVVAPSLSVNPSGAVHGKVKVDELRSQGEIAGEFDAGVVQLSGVVKDNTVIRAKSLEVKLASANGKMQVVFGECTLDVGDMSKEAEKDESAKAGDKEGGGGRKGKGGGERRNSVPPPGEGGQ